MRVSTVVLSLMLLSGAATGKDFGRLGDLWPVQEADMLDLVRSQMQARVDDGSWEREMDAFKQRAERNSQRPAPVEGIGVSERYEARFFDPSVQLSADLKDDQGRIFAHKGEVINPLATVPFAQTLYFIDGDDPAQIAWMQRQQPQTLMVKIILVNGNIPETSEQLNSRIYFDQGGALSRRFGLTAVPARITAAPSGLRLRIETIPAADTAH